MALATIAARMLVHDRSERTAAFLLGALVLFPPACGDAASSTGGAAEPPLPDHLADPLVAQRVDAARRKVVADRLDAAAWKELGMVYRANWYPELAETCYERAVALSGDDAPGWFYLALARAELSKPQASLEAMERAIEVEPAYAPAHWRQGLLLLEAGRLQEAERAFERATDLDLADPAGWFGLARVYVLQGRSADAAALIEMRLLHGPFAPYARHLLATAYRRLGRLDDARTLLAEGAKGPPPWTDPWSDRVHARRTGLQPERGAAAALIKLGRYAEAITRLQALQEHWPNDLEVLNHLGVALVRSGQPARAESVLQAALALNPDHHVTLTNLGLVRFEGAADSAEWAEALEYVERSLQVNPTYADTHELQARIHFHSGRFDDAIASYRSALDRDARRTGLLVEIGRCQIALRRWAEAAATLEEAVDRDPAEGQAHLGLGIAKMELGELDEAAASFERARPLFKPGTPGYTVLQGRLDSLRRRNR